MIKIDNILICEPAILIPVGDTNFSILLIISDYKNSIVKMTIKITVKCLAVKNYNERGISKTTFVPVGFPFSSFRSMISKWIFCLSFLLRFASRSLVIVVAMDL